MKLPNFRTFEPLNALKQQMGIPREEFGTLVVDVAPGRLTPRELAAINSPAGLDVSLDEIIVLQNQTLAVKGQRVVIYIRDNTNYMRQFTDPRFHFFNCDTIKEMREKNRFGRYVACNETSGQFQLNIMVRGGDNPIARDLSVCRHCLEGMPYKNYSRASSPAVKQKAVDSFSRADFFEQYPKSCLDEYPKHDWKTAPINAYPPGFGEVSRHYRQLAGFRCQEASCGVDLSAREHRWFLETHHKNGQKDDNSAANLIPLCVYCHANQFQHSQVKNTPKYKKFLAIRLQLLQLQRAKSNHS